MMKNFLVLLLLLSGFSSAQAEPLTLTFDDLPKWVANENRSVLAGQSFVEGAQSQTGHLNRSFLPRIRADGGGELEKTGTFDANVQPYGEIETRVNVFRGGKDRLEEKVLGLEVDLSKARKDKIYLQELAHARLLYAEGLYYQQLLRALPRVTGQTRAQLGRVQKQISAGLAPESDRLGFEIFLNRLKADKLLQEEDHEHALSEVKAILGIPFDTSIKLVLRNESALLKGLLNAPLNVEEHQDIILLKKKAEITAFKQRKESKWWTPAIDVYGGYALYTFRQLQEQPLNERTSAFTGVNLSFQIFDGLEARTRKRALQHQGKGYALQAEQKRRELETLFEKLKHELKNRRELMAIISKNVGLGKNYLTMTSDEYRRGVKTGPELLDALKKYWEDMRHLAEVQREYLQIKAKLMALLGR